jgi:primosomal protein N'
VIDEEHDGQLSPQDSPSTVDETPLSCVLKKTVSSGCARFSDSIPGIISKRQEWNSTNTLSLPERVGARPMASASIIDMRNVILRGHGKPRVFSDELLEAIQQTH